MAYRTVGQGGFADQLVAARKGLPDGLRRIAELVDWASLEKQLGWPHSSAVGEKAYPPLVMLKVLLLQSWYELSDPEMEAALDDRLSFRRFAGLSLEDAVPDHSTIWRFREWLARSGLDQTLMSEVERQLGAHKLLVRRGTLIDASLVSSAARRPRMDEAKTSPVDPDARFGTANERGRYVFGYKMHVAVDAGSALVRKAILTPANIQDVTQAQALVCGDETTLYADRGYDSASLHEHLAKAGIADGIMRRRRGSQPLSDEEQGRNNALSLIRRSVEKVFGTFKRHYRLDRMRYFNMARNRVRLTATAIAYNLRRMAVLMPA